MVKEKTDLNLDLKDEKKLEWYCRNNTGIQNRAMDLFM